MSSKRKLNKSTTVNNTIDVLENYFKTHPLPKVFKKGEIVEGVIKLINHGEWIVDVGGRAEGIVVGKELKLDGKKVKKSVGEKVLLYVVKPENSQGLVELSIRKTGLALKLYNLEMAKQSRKPVDVRVIEANTGGVLVEIENGLMGFIPRTHLSSKYVQLDSVIVNKEEAKKALQKKLAELIGSNLKVIVKEVNTSQAKPIVILSEREAVEELVQSQNGVSNLLTKSIEELKIGDVLEGKVVGIAPFGLFVNAQGIEGLVHLSEISWNKVNNPSDYYKIDQNVTVQIIGFDNDGKRVAYSIKRLQPDHWKELIQKYSVGQVVEGEVQSIAHYGVFVKIEEGLNGLIHISELSTKLVKDPGKLLKIGDKIRVMIISISKEERHLGLSLKKVQSIGDKKTDLRAVDEVGAIQMKELDKIIQSASTTTDSPSM
jgi:small subunit ribosomal protein S1